jgi:hypothetical protein
MAFGYKVRVYRVLELISAESRFPFIFNSPSDMSSRVLSAILHTRLAASMPKNMIQATMMAPETITNMA